MAIGTLMIGIGSVIILFYIRYSLNELKKKKTWLKLIYLLIAWESISLLALGGLCILAGVLKILGAW